MKRSVKKEILINNIKDFFKYKNDKTQIPDLKDLTAYKEFDSIYASSTKENRIKARRVSLKRIAVIAALLVLCVSLVIIPLALNTINTKIPTHSNPPDIQELTTKSGASNVTTTTLESIASSSNVTSYIYSTEINNTTIESFTDTVTSSFYTQISTAAQSNTSVTAVKLLRCYYSPDDTKYQTIKSASDINGKPIGTGYLILEDWQEEKIESECEIDESTLFYCLIDFWGWYGKLIGVRAIDDDGTYAMVYEFTDGTTDEYIYEKNSGYMMNRVDLESRMKKLNEMIDEYLQSLDIVPSDKATGEYRFYACYLTRADIEKLKTTEAPVGSRLFFLPEGITAGYCYVRAVNPAYPYEVRRPSNPYYTYTDPYYDNYTE